MTTPGSAQPLDRILAPDALAGAAADRDAALLRLRAFLVAVGWFELERRREQVTLPPAQTARLVRESAEAACATVVSRLGDYRGQSRFAVWVAKFAIHEAASAVREIAVARRKAEPVGDTNPPATCEGGPA